MVCILDVSRNRFWYPCDRPSHDWRTYESKWLSSSIGMWTCWVVFGRWPALLITMCLMALRESDLVSCSPFLHWLSKGLIDINRLGSRAGHLMTEKSIIWSYIRVPIKEHCQSKKNLPINSMIRAGHWITDIAEQEFGESDSSLEVYYKCMRYPKKWHNTQNQL